MAVAVPLRVGSKNQQADKLELFLKVFGGEVMTAFAEKNVIMDKHFVRTIESGKSATFPFTGKITASYHTVGTEIVGADGNVSEQIITIDDLLIAPVFIAQIDELMNHFDVRSVYSTETGNAIANQLDTNVFQTGLLAARSASPLTGGPGGGVLTDADFSTVADDLVAGIFASAQALDEKDVPETDRWMYMRPAEFYLLANSSKAQHRDFGGQGSVAAGTIIQVAGIPIVKSNHVPSTNVTTGPSKYQGNFSTTVGLCMQRLGVGTVKLLDMGIDAEWDIRRQGWLIVAKVLLGHGVLRPACAVEFKTA